MVADLNSQKLARARAHLWYQQLWMQKSWLERACSSWGVLLQAEAVCEVGSDKQILGALSLYFGMQLLHIPSLV